VEPDTLELHLEWERAWPTFWGPVKAKTAKLVAIITRFPPFSTNSGFVRRNIALTALQQRHHLAMADTNLLADSLQFSKNNAMRAQIQWAVCAA
jgi:hypothetical protein